MLWYTEPVSESAIVPAKVGAPSTYSTAEGERVCRAIEAGISLRLMRRINKRKRGLYPEPGTLYDWAEVHPEFKQRLARARATQAAIYAEDSVALVDAVDPDHEYGGHRVSKAREQANGRRWLAGCLDRDTYGDRGAQVNMNIGNVVVLAAILPPRPLQPDLP